MKNKKQVILSLSLLVLGFVAVTIFYNQQQSNHILSFENKDQAPFVRSYSPHFGGNENSVTVVEFLDPECEACGAFHPYSKRVFKEYDQEIQWVIRYLANHNNSEYVVKILEASRNQKRYNEVLDIIFDTQPLWAPHNKPNPNLIWKYLANVQGLDVEQLRKDVETIDISEMLLTDRKDASALNVRGTPTFFVNGKKLDKLGYEGLLDLVESEIYK